MNKKLIGLLTSVILLTPVAAMALASPPNVYNGGIETLVNSIVGVIERILWTIAVAFVIIMFVVAGFKFFTAQGDASKVAEARQAVIWGLVGTAVIVLAWSVVLFVRNQFGV